MIYPLICLICALVNVPMMLEGNVFSTIAFVWCMTMTVFCFVIWLK